MNLNHLMLQLECCEKEWMDVNQYSTGEPDTAGGKCPISLSTNRPYSPLIEFDTSKDSSNRSAQFILTFVKEWMCPLLQVPH